MAKATGPAPALSGEQLSELLRLIKGADSVELKLTVPESDQRSAARSLELDVLDAQIRQVVFFDTPDLALHKSGVVVRARRVQGKGDDSVVKLRPVVPGELSPKLRKSPNFAVEVDAMPGGFVCSASLKAQWGPGAVKGVLAGDRPIRKLFTGEQRAFFAANAPEGITLDDLLPLGPLNVLKLRFAPSQFPRRMVAELWFYPNGRRILELSTKCLPAETFQVAAETRAFLADAGVNLGGQQQTKTRTALLHFSKALRARMDVTGRPVAQRLGLAVGTNANVGAIEVDPIAPLLLRGRDVYAAAADASSFPKAARTSRPLRYRMISNGMSEAAKPMPVPGASTNHRNASNSEIPATMIANVHAQGWSDQRPNAAASHASPAAIASHPHNPVCSRAGRSPKSPNQSKPRSRRPR